MKKIVLMMSAMMLMLGIASESWAAWSDYCPSGTSAGSTCKKCGTDCAFTQTSTGTVTLYGSGEVADGYNIWDGTDYYSGTDGSKHPFYGNRNINSVRFDPSSNFTSIGSSAFGSMTNLSSITIPNTITSIGNYALRYNKCTSLTIPDSVTYLGENALAAFDYQELIIPSSLTNIASDPLGLLGSPNAEKNTMLKNMQIICKGSMEDCQFLGNKWKEYAYWYCDKDSCGYKYIDITGNLVTDDGCFSNDSFFVNGKCYGCWSPALTCIWKDKVIATSCVDGYILGDGQCYKCSSPAATCKWDGEKLIATSCIGGYILAGGKCETTNGLLCSNNGDTNYCARMVGGNCEQYVIDEDNKAVAKISCNNCVRHQNKTNCQTELYDENGQVIAEYNDNSEPVSAYDYDDKGSVIAEYNDQCVIESCADGYLERDNSCVKKCGPGYRDMGGFCNHIQWTPAEAAAVLTDDNNNSVTITFRK